MADFFDPTPESVTLGSEPVTVLIRYNCLCYLEPNAHAAFVLWRTLTMAGH